MTTFGLTLTGFVPKTTEILIAEINADLQVAFGASINVTTGVLARLVAIFADRLASLWALGEEINASQDPDSAAATRLDGLCAITGTLRRAATFSAAILTLTGIPATLVPTGNRARTASTLAEFATSLDATIVALDAWAGSTTYAIGDLVTNGGNAYVCTFGGMTAGSGGPLTTSSAITDGSATWKWLGSGTGAVDVLSAALVTGPVTAVSGDINERTTAVSGWDGVVNQHDATPGRVVETDEDLRVRRELEVATPGTSPAPAILAALLEVGKGTVDAVTAATVFYNSTDYTDADGIPPHAVEALVRGGTDDAIRACLLANVAAGIGTHGTETGNIVDSQGTNVSISFSRPSEIPIYVDVTLLKVAGQYPTDGDAQVKAAIVAWGLTQTTGRNAIASAISAQGFKVAGVYDVPPALISLSPTPTVSTSIPISLRELATYDTSRIAVHSSSGVP